jgi:anti-sigma B factor antagonist
MEIAERRIGDVTVLTLTGRLVLEDGEAQLRDRVGALLSEGRHEVVLNLHDIVYIDSCGVGTLVETYHRFRRLGGDVKLLCLSERCRHVLAVTGLIAVFRPYESEEAAVRACAAVGEQTPAPRP